MSYQLKEKAWILLLLIVFTGCGQTVSRAEEKPAGEISDKTPTPQKEPGEMSGMFRGTVMEVIHAGNHIYLHIDTGEKRIWVTVPIFDGKTGDKVLIPPGVTVDDFYSKRLNRRFDRMYFVGGIRQTGDAGSGQPLPEEKKRDSAEHPGEEMPMTHPSMDDRGHAPAAEIGKMEVAKAGITVFEILTDGKNLAGKEVLVRAKVVRFTSGIMDKNWLHVRDGSGDEGTNDLIVTTDSTVKVGDVVLIRGVVATDRDFGYGLKYRVLIEDAQVTIEP